ncbi:esterase/lipase family protein [Chondromyces apiculatus]|uniref:Putative lipase transmembrane protein n=1 Tax=Chondromyces apiculatus DSM 436 TaxID=1192034 RepID=A0A017SU60_9BACT|nr:hypothetical protein [Chondromyces apiculatus]EYF00317.1 putative lipase transmembrane protein [Chondromyces apiculatus DSM 436]
MRRRLSTQALATAGQEVAAFARHALLMRHDAARAVLPEGVCDGDDVVVLLHGMFATAGVVRPLRAAIGRMARRAVTVHTAAVSYPSTSGLGPAVERLEAAVRALPGGARLHLCGHSMGGVVCRLYALESGDARVVQTISLGTPFGGVPGAQLLGFAGGRELSPTSEVLRRVRLGMGAEGREVPHLSIVAGADSVVRAPLAHALPGGDVKVMEGRGHSALLFDDEVAGVLVRRVLEHAGRGG